MMGVANSANAFQQPPTNGAQPISNTEPIIHSWYLINHINSSSNSKGVITNGFDITPDEYYAANHLLIDLLYNLRNRGLREGSIMLWPVIEKFVAECPFWTKRETSFGTRIPETWKRKCLDGWIEEIFRMMAVKKFPVPVPHPRRVVKGAQEAKVPGPELAPIGRPDNGCEDCVAMRCPGHGKMLMEPPFVRIMP